MLIRQGMVDLFFSIGGFKGNFLISHSTLPVIVLIFLLWLGHIFKPWNEFWRLIDLYNINVFILSTYSKQILIKCFPLRRHLWEKIRTLQQLDSLDALWPHEWPKGYDEFLRTRQFGYICPCMWRQWSLFIAGTHLLYSW